MTFDEREKMLRNIVEVSNNKSSIRGISNIQKTSRKIKRKSKVADVQVMNAVLKEERAWSKMLTCTRILCIVYSNEGACTHNGRVLLSVARAH